MAEKSNTHLEARIRLTTRSPDVKNILNRKSSRQKEAIAISTEAQMVTLGVQR